MSMVAGSVSFQWSTTRASLSGVSYALFRHSVKFLYSWHGRTSAHLGAMALETPSTLPSSSYIVHTERLASCMAGNSSSPQS